MINPNSRPLFSPVTSTAQIDAELHDTVARALDDTETRIADRRDQATRLAEEIADLTRHAQRLQEWLRDHPEPTPPVDGEAAAPARRLRLGPMAG